MLTLLLSIFTIPTTEQVLNSFDVNTTVNRVIISPNVVFNPFECEVPSYCELWNVCIVPNLNSSLCWCVIKEECASLYDVDKHIRVWISLENKVCSLKPIYKTVETERLKSLNENLNDLFMIVAFMFLTLFTLILFILMGIAGTRF